MNLGSASSARASLAPVIVPTVSELTLSGLGLGAFFSLMSASFAYEDPLSRASTKLVGTRAQTAFMFKEMGRNMWTTGKGFGKVGALYSGVECCIEGVSYPGLTAR